MIFHSVPSKGVSMVVLWDSYGVSKGCLCDFLWIPTVFLRYFYDSSMRFLPDVHEVSIGFLWYFYEITMGLKNDFYGISMIFLEKFFGNSMGLP